MNLIKKCLISLFALSMLVVVPNNVVFADENDGIMTIGQIIPVSMSYTDEYTYANGFDTYCLTFSISGTYERGTSNVSNVSVTPNAWWSNGGTDSALSSISVLNVWYNVSYKSNYAIVTVYASISEQNDGSYRTVTKQHSFTVHRYN